MEAILTDAIHEWAQQQRLLTAASDGSSGIDIPGKFNGCPLRGQVGYPRGIPRVLGADPK